MSDGLLAIGAFSRATMLSIKALRAYHEVGILVPARVDPSTGYRSYHSSQLLDAAIIYQLRTLDVPLSDIREVLARRDPAVTRRVLGDHAATMTARLARIERIVAELQTGIDRPAVHTPVHVRDEPHTHTLAVHGRVPHSVYAAFLGEAYPALDAAAERHGVVASGPPGALYPPQIPDDGADDVVAFLPIGRPVALGDGDSRVILDEVAEARVAVLVHAGPYDTIDETYRHLGAWVAEHAAPANLPVRELYTVSYGDTDDPERFLTEICWPIIDPSITDIPVPKEHR